MEFRRFLRVLLVPLATYFVVLPAVTMLATYAVSVAASYSFSTLSLAPLSLSALYWVGRFGDAGRGTGVDMGTSYLGPMPTPGADYNRSYRSTIRRLFSPAGIPVSAYTLYFLGLAIASLLAYVGVVP